MIRNALTIMMVLLIISMPFSAAIDIIDEQDLSDEREVGEDIIVNVDEYQPRVPAVFAQGY